jgi:hypothetical protein
MIALPPVQVAAMVREASGEGKAGPQGGFAVVLAMTCLGLQNVTVTRTPATKALFKGFGAWVVGM